MGRSHGNKSDTPAPEAKPAKGAGATEISEILHVTRGRFEACICGLTPLLHNKMSAKVYRDLLLPRGRKTTLERALTLKHHPIEEFHASAYQLADPAAATLIAMRAAAFKGAMRAAALDLPGAKKAQIGRLVRVEGDLIHIYGIPLLKMDAVRSADINHTPDIRTRACMREWACRLTITFVTPLIRLQAVANLLAGAGMIDGVGDGRPEKGALNYGEFRVCDATDPEFLRIVKTGGRAAQQAAMAHPQPYDEETAELLTWFHGERERRALLGVGDHPETDEHAPRRGRRGGANGQTAVVNGPAAPVNGKAAGGAAS